MPVRVVLDDQTGQARGLGVFMRRAAAWLARREGWGDFAVNVLVTDDTTLRQLNHDFRGLDRTTDVLSFPMQEKDEEDVWQAGDIAISLAAAARRSPLPLNQEIVRLFIHGLLHLYGHDHKTPAQARAMHALTDAALEQSGVLAP